MGNVYNVEELNCTDVDKQMPLRFLYTGDKGSSVYKCGFDVKNIQPEDYGEWRCDVWSYYDGSNKWRSYSSLTSKTFQVEEEKNATTIIREITAEIKDTNAKITKLLQESEEKIKKRLNSIESIA